MQPCPSNEKGVLYDQFLHTVQTRCKACDITNQMNLPSIHWVLAQIVIILAPHVSFVSKVKREGTILYQSNGDIMCALSHSLAKNKNHDCLTIGTDVLNNLLHEQAKGFLRRYKGHLACYRHHEVNFLPRWS